MDAPKSAARAPSSDAVESQETYGFQWKTIVSGLGVFWVSWLLTYALGGQGAAGEERGWSSLRAAGWIFFGAMLSMRALRGFVSHRRLSSSATFLVVWVLAFFVWLVVRYR